jgi:hypothetical protein
VAVLELNVDKEMDANNPAAPAGKGKRPHVWRRRIGIMLAVLILLLVIARLLMPSSVRWYVNRTIDRHPMYEGQIGDVSIHLWRGAYSIEDIRLNKTTGNVPVPLFSSRRVDLAIQWDALLEGKLVGRIAIDQPELNFVDSDSDSADQTGAGGPWLAIIQDLFPFDLNSCIVKNGTIKFIAFDKDPPVEMSLTQLDAEISNLTNVHDETTPLIATVKATGLALDHAQVDYVMKMDPFSYKPTFEMALKLIGLDVTKTNALARAYGQFDFESGWFDLVVELDAREGQLKGYVKPLFRNLQVFSIRNDIAEDNVLSVFWEAIVGAVTGLFENQPRDQLATNIPLEGEVDNPETEILTVLGNVLRNAFIRAYLPRLEGTTSDTGDAIRFGKGSILDPDAPGNDNR